MLSNRLAQVYNFLFQTLLTQIICHGKGKTTVWTALCWAEMKDQSSSVKKQRCIYTNRLKTGDKFHMDSILYCQLLLIQLVVYASFRLSGLIKIR